ncbi:MAG: Asp-tRNA(Asn)/Glu-tRNA(Gln) amidotransferase subunit GatA, partial [Chlorobi bacterium]|nr:Asp-tRNA(Asn)/Glu-tRNA(Gln) amidotransferase subunit GatA [Chlorobiota bacterium]
MTVVDVVTQCLARIRARKDLNAFIEVFDDEAIAFAQTVDQKIRNGRAGELAGMVVAVKDNICVRGHGTTCASRMLEQYIPLYNATAVERLIAADAIIIGKTNLDEFAMGSSSERSIYGPVLHPRDPSRVPGGSSGGSAVAVATGMAHAALGSDTGGSIRLPAAFCGVTGLKPSYGRVSRYGLVAFAPSCDQIGPLAGNVEDITRVLRVISGRD